MSDETYSKKLTCTNCGTEELHDIPKGKTISEYIKEAACTNCNTNKLVKTAITSQP